MNLTNIRTNVPAIAMSLSDIPFPYGPFVPHNVPKQYIENYFSQHGTDQYLELSTTVEDVTRSPNGHDRWVLTLRKYDAVEHVDHWWKEEFDAVVFGNGHYSVPYVCASTSYMCYEIRIFEGKDI
jgi:cation diffusion facilitator CzcD-associated flavoprotein CzcO